MAQDEPMFGKILALLHAQLGIDLTLYKSATLLRRIKRRIAILKLISLKDYLGHLRRHTAEVDFLFNDLLIQFTGFFRDSAVFTALKDRHLSRFLNEKGRKTLRIWVPACSTGEEAYSIAMLCSELIAEKKMPIQVQIFGTDVNEAVLDKARAGFYPDEIKKQISAERRNNFFEKVEGGYQVRKKIRDLCIFAKHDVTADPPFSNIDLISCRNVMIYFTPPLQNKIISVFHYALQPQGLLLLGSAETVGPLTNFFSLEEKKSKLYMKKDGGKNVQMEMLRFPSVIARYQKKPLPKPHALSKQHEKLKKNNLRSLIALAESKAAKRKGKKWINVPILLKNDNVRLKKEIFTTRTSLQSVLEQGDAVNEELRVANEEVISSNEELQSTNEELETAKEELLSSNEELGALNQELESRNTQLERSALVSQQFAAIVESSDDAIISKNLDGNIVTWNKGAERIFGYTAEEIVGKSVTVIIPEDRFDEEPNILARLRQGQQINHYETVRRRKDGGLIDVSLTVSPIRNAAGIVMGASKIARDITEKKRAESDLKQARDVAEKANRAKDEFLAALSHEMRTPLNPVLLVSSDSAANQELAPSVRANFDLIRRNVEIEARLIDDLLDLTRISTGKLKLETRDVVIHEVLKDAIAILKVEANQKQLIIKEKYRGGGEVICGDVVRLHQIFWNVLKNAIKFTPPKGVITLETRVTKKEFQLSVSDTGIGMTKQELECAFNAFRDGNSRESQRFGGLGLGLTIGKNLVELHHGRICAASPGRNFGSTITIAFPVVKHHAAIPQIVSSPSPKTFSGGIVYRILLVEDHGPTREALNQLLSRRRHLVKTAGSISEALACAALNDFDVVISDVGLPDGNGTDLFLKLKTDKPHLKGIALTGFGMEEDINRSNKIGFSAHLTKPVSIEALVKALESLILT